MNARPDKDRQNANAHEFPTTDEFPPTDNAIIMPKTNCRKRKVPLTEIVRRTEYYQRFDEMSFAERMAMIHGECLEPASSKYRKFDCSLDPVQKVLAENSVGPIGKGDFAGRTIRVLELCGGTKNLEHALQIAFPAADIEIVRVDRDPQSGADVIADICFWTGYEDYEKGHFDIIAAWPDCSQLSNMRSTTSTPRDVEGTMRLVSCIKTIIRELEPEFFLIENPHNTATGLCVQPEMADMEEFRQTHSYCKWGFPYPKPTDIWCSHKIPGGGVCRKATPCANKREHGSHPITIQYLKDLWMRHQVPIPLLVAALRSAFRP